MVSRRKPAAIRSRCEATLSGSTRASTRTTSSSLSAQLVARRAALVPNPRPRALGTTQYPSPITAGRRAHSQPGQPARASGRGICDRQRDALAAFDALPLPPDEGQPAFGHEHRGYRRAGRDPGVCSLPPSRSRHRRRSTGREQDDPVAQRRVGVGQLHATTISAGRRRATKRPTSPLTVDCDSRAGDVDPRALRRRRRDTVRTCLGAPLVPVTPRPMGRPPPSAPEIRGTRGRPRVGVAVRRARRGTRRPGRERVVAVGERERCQPAGGHRDASSTRGRSRASRCAGASASTPAARASVRSPRTRSSAGTSCTCRTPPRASTRSTYGAERCSGSTP